MPVPNFTSCPRRRLRIIIQCLCLALSFPTVGTAWADASAVEEATEALRIPILASDEDEEAEAGPMREEGAESAAADEDVPAPKLPERPESFARDAYSEPERLPDGVVHSRWRADQGGTPLRASSLVLANPQGYGVATGIWEHDGSLRMSGFNIPAPAPMFAFPGEDEVIEAETRGLVLSTSPLEDAPERFSVSATYLRGEEASPTPFDTRTRAAGDATSLALDSALLNGKLRMHGEYAYTRHDYDGARHEHDARVDDAQSLEASYAGDPLSLGSDTLNWSAGVRMQEVGEDYRSLGNGGLRSDQAQQTVFSNLNWAGLSLQTETSRAVDNLANDPLRPQVETESRVARLGWRPQDTETREGLLGLFNAPSFNVSVTERERGVADIDSAPWPVDWSGEDVSVTAEFRPHHRSTWSLRYYSSTGKDHTGMQSESQTETFGFNLRTPVGPYLTLSPSLQQTVREDIDNEIDFTTTQAGLRMDLNLSSDWKGSLGMTHSQNDASNGMVDNSNLGVTATLEHQLLETRPKRPGIKLRLDAGYNEYKNELYPDSDDSGFRIYSGIDFIWPSGA